MPASKAHASDHVLRGRSPWPIASNRGRSETSSPSEQTAAQARSSKRKKRSDLSPSSKATHSIIERERREAMNEKFSELAAQVPELVEAIESGKRPTKGEIVKASIARHQAQDRRIQEMQLELQALRASNDLQGITAAQGLAASMPAISVDLSQQQQQTYAMPYQIQPSRPVMQTNEEGSIWLGQLLGKTNDQLDRSPSFQPTLVPSDSVATISPFKQSSLMSCWGVSGFQPQLDSYSFDVDHALLEKSKVLVSNGMLEQLSDSVSTFPSPTFTSSDTDSSFSSDPLDPALDEPTFLTDHTAFEPFVLTDDVAEETSLSALLNLPPADSLEQCRSTPASKNRTLASSRPSSSAKEEREPAAPAFSTLLAAS